MESSIETKLCAARAKLILDKPFLGALVLRLPLKEASADWCKTTATDARNFYFNADYIDSLSPAQTQFMLAHEALHCALSHFARRQHRVLHKWDLACDFAINPLLLEEGLTPPPNAQILHEYKGMAAEEIYPLLKDNEDSETLDQHLYDQENESKPQNQPPKQPPKFDKPEQKLSEKPKQSKPDKGDGSAQGSTEPDSNEEGGKPSVGEGTPPPLSHEERETLDVQWQQRLAGAAQQAMQAGKLGGTLARLIDHLLQPRLPWRMVLAQYLTATARDDYSYMRPSRREGEAIFPSLRSAQVNLMVAVDTSGSIRAAEMNEFLAEINALKGQIRARVTFLPCDAKLAEGAPFVYEPWEDFRLPEQIKGGGGTDFRPVFDWIDHSGQCPELLVYFTDADGAFPEHEANFPVIWLVKGKHKVPWGQRIQLN